MNKFLLLIFPFMFLFLSCTNKPENINALKSIGSTETTKIIKINTYTSEEYKSQALAIVNNAKKRLQDTLPIVINAQVELFENTLIRIEERAVLSLTLDETNYETNLVRADAERILLMDEIRVNKIFYEVVNELVILNLDFNNHFDNKPLKFQDYYDVSPIILREGVLEKVNELVEDEKERIKLEQQENNIETGLMLLAVFPGAASAKDILNKIVKGARAAKKGIVAASKLNNASKITSKFLTKYTSKHFVQPLSNLNKREKIAKYSALLQKASIGAIGLKSASEQINSNKAKQTILVFKSVKNELPGRIGDFSDGILTQPIDFLKKMIYENTELINQSNK